MYRVYQVQNGDTIDTIARLFQTTPENIRRLNGISGEMMLKPGGFLIVPMQDETLFDSYIVKKGDNMYAIARTYGVDYDMLLELNGLDKEDYIYPDQEIIIPKSNVKLYRVEDGDTINLVLQKMGIGFDMLNRYNENIYLMPEQILFYQ